MSRAVLFVFPIIVLPCAAHAAPGADANSALGRDAARPETRAADRQPGLPVLDAGPAGEAASSGAGEVQIGAVQVSGLSQLSQADFADIAERYAGQTVDGAGLRQLARAIADRARERGYIFASAAIPPQQMSVGIVRVTLEEGAIDEVRISGSGNKRLKALVEPLAGRSIRKDVLERQLLLASDIPGIRVTGTRYVREGGKGVLIVEAKDVNARGSATLDNWGPASFGPARARLEFELNGLFDSDDQLVTYTTLTPLEPRELTYVAIRYGNTISASGIQIAISGGAGRTRNRDAASGVELLGRSRYAAATVSVPLLRSLAASFWVSGEFSRQQVVQDFGIFGRQRDDLSTVAFSGWGNVRLGGGRLWGGLSVTRGLGLFGATDGGDPLASRLDGSGRFTKANAWLNWTGKLAGKLSMRLAANGQIASRPLLASQEIGLGGPNFGRGYDFSERFGDQGIVGLAELRRTFSEPAEWLDWAQLYGFVDGGYIDNLRDGFGGGTLMSGGGGVRAGKGGAEIGLELAAPINAERYESGDKSPKVNLVVTYGF